jgi:hypothetical protein
MILWISLVLKLPHGWSCDHGKDQLCGCYWPCRWNLTMWLTIIGIHEFKSLLSIFSSIWHILLGSDEEWETQVRWMFMNVKGKVTFIHIIEFYSYGKFHHPCCQFWFMNFIFIHLCRSSICMIACMWWILFDCNISSMNVIPSIDIIHVLTNFIFTY